jgi:hypothetical protein
MTPRAIDGIGSRMRARHLGEHALAEIDAGADD